MTPRNSKIITIVCLLISAPLLFVAARHLLAGNWAGMAQYLFMGLVMLSAASSPAFLTQKVSSAFATRATAGGALVDEPSLGPLGGLLIVLAFASLVAWVLMD